MFNYGNYFLTECLTLNFHKKITYIFEVVFLNAFFKGKWALDLGGFN